MARFQLTFVFLPNRIPPGGIVISMYYPFRHHRQESFHTFMTYENWCDN